MRILFVDNHPEFTSLVTSSLLAAHEVVIVATVAAARAAVAAAAVSRFDIALVDYDLDDGKGVEFLRWLHSSRSQLPAVAVSARTEGNEALVAAGACGVCSKLDFARIQLVVDEVLRAAS
jgi:DNA-binding response OmpR family regulator